VRWLRRRWAGLALFLSVAGPGIITASVDIDANGIATYSIAAPTMATRCCGPCPATIALVVIQEMNGPHGM
jgi:Mn2+/Fe2+ NRAMP family transporter